MHIFWNYTFKISWEIIVSNQSMSHDRQIKETMNSEYDSGSK